MRSSERVGVYRCAWCNNNTVTCTSIITPSNLQLLPACIDFLSRQWALEGLWQFYMEWTKKAVTVWPGQESSRETVHYSAWWEKIYAHIFHIQWCLRFKTLYLTIPCILRPDISDITCIFSVWISLYFKITFNLRPYFAGWMGGLISQGPLYIESCCEKPLPREMRCLKRSHIPGRRHEMYFKKFNDSSNASTIKSFKYHDSVWQSRSITLTVTSIVI